jgi:hypothetical protein
MMKITKASRGDHSLTEIIVGKHRNGATGSTYLQPQLAFSRFVDTKRLPEAKARARAAKISRKQALQR